MILLGGKMRINLLILQNYRNYKTLKLEFKDNINIFIGDNAQGKTNIVEAIYYAAMGKSHRTGSDNELINWHNDNALINLNFSRLDMENELQIKFHRSKRREIIYNTYSIRPKELIGSLNAVLFSPEDLYLVKGAPVKRRDFLDSEISQSNPNYYKRLIDYNRVLLQRNNLLKKIKERRSNIELLESWDEQLSALAADIVAKRIDAIKKLNMLANLMHRKITANNENLEVDYYIDGFENNVYKNYALWYNKRLEELRDNDIMRGNTGCGPHRDDIILRVNDVNLRNYGSQGQQRTGALSLKLAELEFIRSETGEYPILLLDDVMSELDENRRLQLISFIKDRVQTFITATDKNYFNKGNQGRYYRVNAGIVQE